MVDAKKLTNWIGWKTVPTNPEDSKKASRPASANLPDLGKHLTPKRQRERKDIKPSQTPYLPKEKETQGRWTRNPTTSFLTAATLIYAIGAGITAAAGTRLALQLILVKRFKLYSFQLPEL